MGCVSARLPRLRAVTDEEARRYMGAAGCNAEEFADVGLSVEEA
jgi:hypothetical protein